MSDFFAKAKVFLGFEPETEIVEKRRVTPPSGRNNLIKLNSIKRANQSEVRVIEPRVYEESLTIATFLRESVPVIVNLKYIDATSGKRLIDFVCGTAYAINGHMLKIGENIFLFTPQDMAIVEGDEYLDESATVAPQETILHTNIA